MENDIESHRDDTIVTNHQRKNGPDPHRGGTIVKKGTSHPPPCFGGCQGRGSIIDGLRTNSLQTWNKIGILQSLLNQRPQESCKILNFSVNAGTLQCSHIHIPLLYRNNRPGIPARCQHGIE